MAAVFLLSQELQASVFLAQQGLVQVPFLQASPSVAQHSFLAAAPLVQQEEDEAQEVSPVKATAAARASRDWMCFIVKVKRGRDGRFRKKKWADGKNRAVHFGGMHPAGGG